MDKMNNYGKELILDMHECNPEKFTRESIEQFLIKLCKLINVVRCELFWWDYEGEPEEKAIALPHMKGVTAVQFLTTSNITIHTLDDLRRVYLNIFSCGDFESDIVTKFSEKWFGGNIKNVVKVPRL